MERERLKDLLAQAIETEKGGVLVYQTALRCVVDEGLRKEWTEYLQQTERHVRIITDAVRKLEIDPETASPGRAVVRAKGEALVRAMEAALESGDRRTAELVAAECVVDAENKDHLNWELIEEASKELEDEEAEILSEACDQVEEEEDKHLYHTMGWSRELWMSFLGLPAVLPPPEERKDVDTQLEAARAKEQRGRMLPSRRRTKARAGTRRGAAAPRRGRSARRTRSTRASRAA